MNTHNTDPQDGPTNEDDLATRLKTALAAFQHGREEEKEARRRRIREMGLRGLDGGKVLILIIAIAGVKLLHFSREHPIGVTSATAGAAAVAFAIILLASISGGHRQRGAIPTAPVPPPSSPRQSPRPSPSTPSLPPPTVPPSPTSSIPTGGTTAAPPAATSPPATSPTATDTASQPEASEPISSPLPCLIHLDVRRIARIRVACPHNSTAMLRPLLEAKRRAIRSGP